MKLAHNLSTNSIQAAWPGLFALLPYVLIAFALIATICLFFALKREIGENSRRQKKRIDQMAARLEEASRALSGPAAEPIVEIHTAQPRSGLNLNKRVHAMRMLRRGEDISHIAAALGVPRKEVELLIRVQAITNPRAAVPTP